MPPFQILQRALEMPRIMYLFTVRECGETAYPHIYSDCLSGRRQWLRFAHLANKQNIQAVCTARDPKLFASPFNRPGEPDATASHSGNREFVPFDRTGRKLSYFWEKGDSGLFP